MKVAACLMVRDEADTVLQWLVFHHLAGFDAFIVVDHLSTDDTVREVERARTLVDLRIVSLRRTGPGLQEAVFTAICQATRAEFDWIAFIDIDEYLVGPEDVPVGALCEAHRGSAAVAVPWLMFGSSGHDVRPDRFMVEDYTRRAPVNFRPNHHVKSIVRPSAVKRCINAHCFDVEGATVLPDGRPALWESPGKLETIPQDCAWHVHHYFTRSRAHWAERLARGQLGGFTRTWEDFDTYDRNEVQDMAAARRADAMRALLASLPPAPPR